MPDDPKPLLEGLPASSASYKSPRRGREGAAPPTRIPGVHGEHLRRQLNLVVDQARAREARVEGAVREIITVTPELGSELNLRSLGNKRDDTRVVSFDPETGEAVLDAKNAELLSLRKKLDNYLNEEKLTPKGKRRNAPLLDPVSEIRISSLPDLIGPRLEMAELVPAERHWFELTCRGGRRIPQEEEAASRAQVDLALGTFDSRISAEFRASERVLFFVRMTLEQLGVLVDRTDCVYEVELVEPTLAGWLFLEDPPVAEIQDFSLREPALDAPVVTLLDTGVTQEHPLLSRALSRPYSAIGDSSPQDVVGHGTEMAGVALYTDLAISLAQNEESALRWIQSVRILARDRQGEAAEDQRAYWPRTVEAAVLLAEGDADVGQNDRVYALAVTADNPLPFEPTSWSNSLDLLAAEGGRLFCVAAGNTWPGDPVLLEGYPQLHLDKPIHDPAQAANVLTIGALTRKSLMPQDPDLEHFFPVSSPGGISPHTSAGQVGEGPIKPEVLFEGGNLAYDGQLPNWTLPGLTTMTTGREFLRHPLALMYGTSAATAEAAKFASQIMESRPGLWTETVRGLIVHSASWTEQMREDFPNKKERIAICGYGSPDLQWASECVSDRATIFIEDSLQNSVIERVLKPNPPQRAGARDWDPVKRREMRLFELPVPEDLLLDLRDIQAQLRVTLSYYSEPNVFGRRVQRGLDLRWDIQGPGETREGFLARINALMRDPGHHSDPGDQFVWEIGKLARGRGTVQSDRWVGPASYLAGSRMIAVYPVLGWWEQRKQLETEPMRYSLIVTVRVAGLDVYTPIQQAIAVPVEVEIAHGEDGVR